MENIPEVSVVVITYNQERFIRECIDSILSQECNFDFELIIGDDCSTDATREICLQYQLKYPKKIRLIQQRVNQGVIKNYRDVLALCNGKYIAQCAGDDYWCDKLKLQKQFDILEKSSEFKFIRTGGYALLNNGNLVDASNYNSCVEGNIFEIAKYGSVGLAASIFFSADLLRYINFEDFVRNEFSMEDYPMQAIFSKYTKFAYLPDMCVVYRQNKNSISNPKQHDKRINYTIGHVAVMKYLNQLFPNDCNFDQDELDDKIVYVKLKGALYHFRYTEAKELVEEIKTEHYKSRNLCKVSRNKMLFYFVSICLNVKNKFN